MPVWQVVLLLDLTLGVGLGFGYGVWGHRLAALDGELKAVQTKWSDSSASSRHAQRGPASASSNGRGVGSCEPFTPSYS